MTARQRETFVVAGALAAVGFGSGVAALMGEERLALVGLLVLVTFMAIVLLSIFARVTNTLRSLNRKPTGLVGTSLALSEVDKVRGEAAERRILGGFEAERLRAADRHRDVISSIGQVLSQRAEDRAALHEVGQNVLRVRADGRRSRQDESRAVEALLQLREEVEFRAPMPPAGKWALDTRGLLELLALVKGQAPKTVLELGGGTSTIWLGYVLEKLGGRLVSVDHDAAYADLTQWNVERHGLTSTVDVRIAPLEPWQGADAPLWYTASSIDDVKGIDFLLIDGPPEATASRARYPAVPMLLERLAPGALIVLDDADRDPEKGIVDEWLAESPSLVRVRGDFGRMAVLRYRH